MIRPHDRGYLWATAAVVAFLILLAYFQYTWVGQLSEEEYRRTRSTLQRAAFDASMGFSRQMTLLLKSIGGRLEGSDAAVRAEVHARIHRWQMLGSAPALIADSTWIAPVPFPEEALQLRWDETTSLYLRKDLFALALPIDRQPGRAIHIALRRSTILSEVIPDMLREVSSLAETCDMAVMDPDGRVLHMSPEADLVRLTEAPDATAPLLMLPPRPLSMIDTFRPSDDGQAPEIPRRGMERPSFPRGEMGDRDPERAGRPPFEPRGDRPRMLELRLIQRKGTLEDLVAGNRIRNLGISFGVLILLGVSVVFLIRSAGKAQQLARQQLEFVAGVSHDLRTPLAVLKSAGENLADGVINERERLRQYGTLIKEEVIRLSDMVERTLAFAGIQSGKQVYDAEALDVGALIDRALAETRRRIHDGELSVSLSLAPDLPPVYGDLHVLQSALENLLVNAAKYSRHPRWVGITGRAVQEKNRIFVELCIADRGMGIPPADLKHVFEPFYRGRNAVDGQVRGSGLGLSITRHAVEAHGGRISVKSTVNKGSVFTVLLPAAPPTEAEP